MCLHAQIWWHWFLESNFMLRENGINLWIPTKRGDRATTWDNHSAALCQLSVSRLDKVQWSLLQVFKSCLLLYNSPLPLYLSFSFPLLLIGIFFRTYEDVDTGDGFGLSFAGAQEFCKSQGGHLATYSDADEENTFDTWYSYSYGFWIGMRQYVEGGQNEESVSNKTKYAN